MKNLNKIFAISCAVLFTSCGTKQGISNIKTIDDFNHINTRIVIANVGGLPITSNEKIANDIILCEKTFDFAKVKFYISYVEHIDLNQKRSFQDCLDDSLKYPNVLSIYYVFLNEEIQPDGSIHRVCGRTTMPFMQGNAISIASQYPMDHTLSHEFGHWAGNLYHVFETDDFVDDTPEVHGMINVIDCNLMNYANCDSFILTEGQKKRFTTNFFFHRNNYLIKNKNLVK